MSTNNSVKISNTSNGNVTEFIYTYPTEESENMIRQSVLSLINLKLEEDADITLTTTVNTYSLVFDNGDIILLNLTDLSAVLNSNPSVSSVLSEITITRTNSDIIVFTIISSTDFTMTVTGVNETYTSSTNIIN